jgi:hypothetical protein
VARLLALAPDAIVDAISPLGARAVEYPCPRNLRLGAHWRNVTVLPGAPLIHRSGAFYYIIGHSRRLGEARWRWVPRTFALPPGVISLLIGPPRSEYEDFRAERNELVRRHANLVGSSPGYSGISVAPIFVG